MRLTSLSLSLSLPPLSLCGSTTHVIWCPLPNILFLINFTFFTSCLSIAHLKFTNKIHQLFTGYLLRLPYSELLETHLFRSRANRRLVSSCRFFWAPDSGAIGVIISSIGRVACLRFGAGWWCRCRVPLQGAAARCWCQGTVCILELGCWCSCRGATAGCRCKVLLSECCLRFGAWLLRCCQSAACAFEPGCCCATGCCCRVLLQSATAGAVAVASFARCCPGRRTSFHFPSSLLGPKGPWWVGMPLSLVLAAFLFAYATVAVVLRAA